MCVRVLRLSRIKSDRFVRVYPQCLVGVRVVRVWRFYERDREEAGLRLYG